jgi:hypothetical protein
MRSIITIILVSFSICAAGQMLAPCKDITVNEKGDTIFTVVDKAPYLKDGIELYGAWIVNNADRKLIPREKTGQKKLVFIGFVVHEDGTTSDFKLLKGIGDPYDKEALRLASTHPHLWVAGQCGDKRVKTRINIPIRF